MHHATRFQIAASLLIGLGFSACSSASPSAPSDSTSNEPRPASESQAGWYAGNWNATRGIASDGETRITGKPRTVSIRHLGGARIERSLAMRDGTNAVTSYTVMQFGNSLPWWTEDMVGNMVTRRVDDNTFELAAVGNLGTTDWSNGWTYVRVIDK